jgi:hypothetical protein
LNGFYLGWMQKGLFCIHFVGMINMVHTTDTKAWDGEGTHVHLMNETTRKATRNEKQRRSRACRRFVVQNVMQNATQNVVQNVEQNVPIIEANPMLENPIVNLKISTSRATK